MISAARNGSPRGLETASGQNGPRPTPFDYAFRYELTGTPGKVINQVITISVEATFTAVSIGYGVIPKVQPIFFAARVLSNQNESVAARRGGIPQQKPLATITIEEIVRGLKGELDATSRTLTGETGPEAVLRNGIKLNPDVAEFALQNLKNSNKPDIPADIFKRLFQVVGSPSELIQFKYALFDEGSGREFQSAPILSTAGLGSANGERPFRYFARPIVFKPKSTIRMEVTEVSDFQGDLHVALHGYRVLGDPNSAKAVAQRRRSTRR